MGVIDVEAPSALLAVSGADIVLLAVPVPPPRPRSRPSATWSARTC
jgi:predicted dinucleotide-binding enzyme